MKRLVWIGVASLCLAGPARAQTVSPLQLSMAQQAAPAWRGISADEAAGAQGLGMLYPAPNAAGLLAAILTHALLVQGGREAERQARQKQADLVLAPHADTIAALTAERLLEATRQRLAPPLLESAQGLVVQMQPSFALAPDHRTLVLDNVVRVHAVDTPAVARFENIVRVVSDPRSEADPAAAWGTDAGQPLRDEAAALLAHSTEIALARLAAADPDAFRTQRYAFGDTRKMERGQPVAQGCGRVVLRTLRDGLMSVPVQPEAGAPPCTERYRLATP